MLPGITPALLPKDRFTKLLLHMDGAQGGQVFTDSSSFAKTIGVNGGYQTWNGQKKFGPTSGTYNTNASSDSCYVSNASGDPDFSFGTADFTIEMWVSIVTPNLGLLYDARPNTSVVGAYAILRCANSNINFAHANNGVLDRITGTTTLTANTFYHVAVVRSFGITKMYLNGAQEGSTYTDSASYLNGANRPLIGGNGISQQFNGYIDELRVSVGAARFTAPFTPPTVPYV